MFIGYYSLANAVTLAGLLFSVTACTLAMHGGNIEYAVYMMFVSLLCDMFDGRLARRKKNRSKDARLFGIQLDSLCDLVSFGITPCIIAYYSGFNGVFDVIIYGFFSICGAIRLAYFNTIAINSPDQAKEGYRGLPIPSSMVAITFIFMLNSFGVPHGVMSWLVRIIFIAIAICFVYDFPMKKSGIKGTVVLISIEVIMMLLMIIASGSREDANGGEDISSPDVSDVGDIGDVSDVSDVSEVSA